MALEVANALAIPEPPFTVKEPNFQDDPRFIRYAETHFARGGETYPEYLVWFWLTHKRGFVEYEDFQMYATVGPFQLDSLWDATITGKRAWVEVYGTAFHSAPVRKGPETLAVDIVRREFALSNGFEFIRLKDTDLVDRLDYTMSMAVLGIEIAQFPG